jgi:hypothetical protein
VALRAYGVESAVPGLMQNREPVAGLAVHGRRVIFGKEVEDGLDAGL